MDTDPSISIMRKPCEDCPFKGRFIGLRSGRLKDIIDDTNKNDAYFVCHKTVYEKDADGSSDAVFGSASVCAGWLEAVRLIHRVPTIIQIAERMGLVKYRESA